MTVSDQLRDAIRRSGLTHYRIGTDTGINIRTIDRFVSGKPMHSDTIDAVCEYLGLELRPVRAPQKQTGKKTGTSRKQSRKK